MPDHLIQGEDFYYSEEGYIVLTEAYHLKKGHCCGNGCLHCPFNYSAVPEPKKSELQAKKGYEKKGRP